MNRIGASHQIVPCLQTRHAHLRGLLTPIHSCGVRDPENVRTGSEEPARSINRSAIKRL